MSVSIRPEQIAISLKHVAKKHNVATGVVDQIAYMGSYSLFYIRLTGGKLIVASVSRLVTQLMERMPSYDDTVYVSWEPMSCVVLA